MSTKPSQIKPDISVVVNVHHEGRLFHHTARSLNRSLLYATANNLSVEVVVVGDRIDLKTSDYLKTTLPAVVTAAPFSIVEVDFGDLGLSRNYGVSKAAADVVAFLDGDNLFSEYWLVEAYGVLSQNPQSVVHPEFFYTFEKYNVIMRNIASTDQSFDPRKFAEENYWDAACMTTKSILEETPYIVTRAGEGYGPEDWHWNMETIKAGVQHLVVEGSVFFYRVKTTGSLLAAHLGSNALLPPSTLLTPSGLGQLKLPEQNENSFEETKASLTSKKTRPYNKKLLRSGTRYVIANAGRVTRYAHKIHPRLGAFERELQDSLLRLFAEPALHGPHANAIVPDKIKKELRSLNEIDPYLFATERVEFYSIQFTPFTDLYWKYANIIGEDTDYLFFLPWLKRGGADKVALNYINAIVQQAPTKKITVILTDDKNSPWAKRLPKTVKTITLDDAFYGLGEYMQDRLLATLMVQLQPKSIHLINSIIGYRMLGKYAKAITHKTKLYVSLFCVDITSDGRLAHISLEKLDSFIDYTTAIYTDNKDVIDFYESTLAFDRKKFKTHYQPIAEEEILHKERSPGSPLKVLWAGRHDRQKRLDILYGIAAESARRRLDIEFHVWGDAVVDSIKKGSKEMPDGRVIMHGPFDGMSSIGPAGYDVFMLTSQWEGLPNAPMEAVAGGLATLVVPSVGGLPELVNEKTGYLVLNYSDIPAYVDSLELIIKGGAELFSKQKELVNLVNLRHNWGGFIKTLKDDRYL